MLTPHGLVADYVCTEALSWDIELPSKRNAACHVFPFGPWSPMFGQVFQKRRYEYVRLRRVSVMIMPQPELNLERPYVELLVWGSEPALIADRVSFKPDFGRQAWLHSRWPCEVRKTFEGITWDVSEEFDWVRNSFVRPKAVDLQNTFLDIGYSCAMNTEFSIAAQVIARLTFIIELEYAQQKLSPLPGNPGEIVPQEHEEQDWLESLLLRLQGPKNEWEGSDPEWLTAHDSLSDVHCMSSFVEPITFNCHIELSTYPTDELREDLRAGRSHDSSLVCQQMTGDRVLRPASVTYNQEHTTPVVWVDRDRTLCWMFAWEVAMDMHITVITTGGMVQIERWQRYPVPTGEHRSFWPYGPAQNIHRNIYREDPRDGRRQLLHSGSAEIELVEVDIHLARNDLLVIEFEYVESTADDDLLQDILEPRRLREQDRIITPALLLHGKAVPNT